MITPIPHNRHFLWAAATAILLIALGRMATAATFTVEVAPYGDIRFSPVSVSIKPGDTVTWVWKASGHSVTSGTPLAQTNLFDSGVLTVGSTFSFTFTDPGTFTYFCRPHGCCGMVGNVMVAGTTPTPTPAPQLLNVSTRMQVQTGENVLIGGFIVTGNDPKKVIFRAIGPSLKKAGIADALADPVLELHGSGGALIASNDNWKETQQAEIEATGIAPANDLESAIVATLDPDSYTAIVSGKNGTSGIGLVEGYDLDQPADSQLANISTRGFVETENNVMIGGFILLKDSAPANLLIRALGPSLSKAGITGALPDPTLELHDSNGDLIASNDNWRSDQEAEIKATTIPPKNDLESAILATLQPDSYTAIVAGKDGLTGVGLVEVYELQ